ncbi:hypothetical protein V8E36_009718, partial [Tilletia maclaganii]
SSPAPISASLPSSLTRFILLYPSVAPLSSLLPSQMSARPFLLDEAEDRGNDSLNSSSLSSLTEEPSDAHTVGSQDSSSADSNLHSGEDESDPEGQVSEEDRRILAQFFRPDDEVEYEDDADDEAEEEEAMFTSDDSRSTSQRTAVSMMSEDSFVLSGCRPTPAPLRRSERIREQEAARERRRADRALMTSDDRSELSCEADTVAEPRARPSEASARGGNGVGPDRQSTRRKPVAKIERGQKLLHFPPSISTSFVTEWTSVEEGKTTTWLLLPFVPQRADQYNRVFRLAGSEWTRERGPETATATSSTTLSPFPVSRKGKQRVQDDDTGAADAASPGKGKQRAYDDDAGTADAPIEIPSSDEDWGEPLRDESQPGPSRPRTSRPAPAAASEVHPFPALLMYESDESDQ